VKQDGTVLEGKQALAEIRSVVAKTFADRKEQPTFPEWAKKAYDKNAKGIPDALFSGILDPPTTEEIESLILDSSGGNSGHGFISNAILRMVLARSGKSSPLATALQLIISEIFKLGVLPPCLSHVAMRMIPKNGINTSADNLRPISVIPELSKVASKVLAHRIGRTLTRYPKILHSSQRGFLRDGNISQAISTVIDIIEDSSARGDGAELFLASVDQKKAYDSVQPYTIALSLKRFNFPDSFIRFIMSSITGSTARIVTGFGNAEPFPLLTSVKQGDPIAPLLFVFVVDCLHEGLQRNPLYEGKEDGYHMHQDATVKIASTAYADDFTTFSTSIEGLTRMHTWIIAFLKFHHMSINSSKSFYTYRTISEASPPPLTDPLTSISIPFRKPSEAFRHLGIQLNIHLNWSAQRTLVSQQIAIYRRMMEKFETAIRAVVAREYLHSKLHLAMIHIPLKTQELLHWDTVIRSCVLEKTSILAPNSFSKAAFSLITGILPLQHLYDIRHVSELFIKLNSSDPSSSLALLRIVRWTLGKKADNFSQATKEDAVNRAIGVRKATTYASSRTECAVAGAERFGLTLQWNSSPWYSLHPCDINQTVSLRELRLWHSKIGPYNNPNCLISSTLASPPGSQWEAYTDGSTARHGQGPSGLGVVLSHCGLPYSFELGKPFKASGNNFSAETMAILLALRMTPINHSLNIYTDSLAACYAVTNEDSVNEYKSQRQWIRTAARPIIRSIMKILRARTANTKFIWVKAHTGLSDEHSLGNERADKLAGDARRRAEQEKTELPEFLFNEERVIARYVPVQDKEEKRRHSAERHPPPAIHVSGDIANIMKIESRRQLSEEFKEQKCGELFKCNPSDALELFRIIRSRHRSKELEFILETVTQTGDTYYRRQQLLQKDNEIEFKRVYSNNRYCLFCNTVDESTSHIYQCPAALEPHLSEINAIKQAADPLYKLNGACSWFFSAPGNQGSLLLECSRSGLIDEKQPSSSLTSIIDDISKFPKLAGSIGILPTLIDDFYMAYFAKFRPELRGEEKVGERRKLVTSTKLDIRMKCLQLSVEIWSEWRHKKKQLIAKTLRKASIAEALERKAQQEREERKNLEDFERHRREVAAANWRREYERRHAAQFRHKRQISGRPSQRQRLSTAPPIPKTNRKHTSSQKPAKRHT
jgi:ribonuclease HI